VNEAIYNPENLPIEELPVIYGFNNGCSPGWMTACLIASDGAGMGSHICSHECFMPYDLGIVEGSRPDRHEGFREHFPRGYRMEFVSGNPRKHEGLMAAYALNQANAPKEAA